MDVSFASWDSDNHLPTDDDLMEYLSDMFMDDVPDSIKQSIYKSHFYYYVFEIGLRKIINIYNFFAKRNNSLPSPREFQEVNGTS